MDVVPFEGFLRLLAPVFLTWLAWIVWRTPYQERANRRLALFLAAVAAGFWMELMWVLARTGASWAVAVRDLQALLGVVDPVLLLAFALAYRPSVPRWLRTAWYAVWVLVGVGLWLVGLGSSDIRDPTVALAHVVFVNGTYALAFVVLLVSYTDEGRSYLARQLGFLAVGVGFAAMSRSQALFFTGGPSWAVVGAPFLQIGYGALVALVLLGLIGTAVVLRGARERSAWPILGALVALLAVYYVVLTSMVWLEAVSRFGYLRSMFFGLRWVVFALVVGFGILRYQLFDFDLRVRQAAALLVAVGVAVALAMVSGALAFDAGLDLLQARLIGLLVALALLVPLHRLTGRTLAMLLPRTDSPAAYATRRLEIYEATLEYALAKPEWTEEERRFVETLREVFDVTPEEHARVVGRLQPRALGEPTQTSA